MFGACHDGVNHFRSDPLAEDGSDVFGGHGRLVREAKTVRRAPGVVEAVAVQEISPAHGPQLS